VGRKVAAGGLFRGLDGFFEGAFPEEIMGHLAVARRAERLDFAGIAVEKQRV
jgi:hypothetical protein